MIRLPLNKTQHPGRRQVRRWPACAFQVSEPRPATRANWMTLPAAMRAVAGKQLEQLSQLAVRPAFVRKPITPIPPTQGAVETNDEAH